MQESKGRQSGIVRNVMRLLLVCGFVNGVLALIELVVLWPGGQWSSAFVDVLLDIGLSIVVVLVGISIYKKGRWYWIGAIGLLGFLVLNQSVIATAIWSLNNQGHIWAILLTAWMIAQGALGLYLLFSKNV